MINRTKEEKLDVPGPECGLHGDFITVAALEFDVVPCFLISPLGSIHVCIDDIDQQGIAIHFSRWTSYHMETAEGLSTLKNIP